MSQWQLELKKSITSYQELFKIINLDVNLINCKIFNNNSSFPLFITRSFVDRITKNNIKDPLLLQILPTNKETKFDSNYYHDPLQEKNFNNIPGLIHKYFGRILLLTSKACAINCRYCFRQHFPYTANIANGSNLTNIINYIQNNNSINEVILSGGDPLLAPNNYFKKLLAMLDPIEHLKILRIHSRIPVILPSRLELELIEILLKSRLNIVLVIHSNHPNEINQEVADHFKILHKTNITLLNQSVLLKNINNSAEVLARLSYKLFNSIKVLPYYLHVLDRVSGTMHFKVTISSAKKIFKELSGKLPGYLVPRLVVEQPNKASKTIIS